MRPKGFEDWVETESGLTHAVSVPRNLGGAGADLGLGVGCSLYREEDLPASNVKEWRAWLGPCAAAQMAGTRQRLGRQPSDWVQPMLHN
jgi:hypothetical protein